MDNNFDENQINICDNFSHLIDAHTDDIMYAPISDKLTKEKRVAVGFSAEDDDGDLAFYAIGILFDDSYNLLEHYTIDLPDDGYVAPVGLNFISEQKTTSCLGKACNFLFSFWPLSHFNRSSPRS